MPQTITLTQPLIEALDLTPAHGLIQPWLSQEKLALDGVDLRFEVNIPRDPTDPRELSEIPEIRLWFLRLDAHYPWLPLILDWEAGELGRYAAMLVPHQFSPREGIRYNPESLELFVMGKIFAIAHWLNSRNLDGQKRLQFMTQMLGYELDDALFKLL